jgi:hypothetical protein
LVELDSTDGLSLEGLIRRDWSGGELRSIRDLAEVLRRELDLQARLFFVTLSAERSVEEWLDEARSFLDRLSKAGPGAAVGILVLPESGGYTSTRLELAWPLLEVRTSTSSPWGTYLHERIAWHAGGDIDTAEEVAELLSVIQVGQDTVLEKALDDHSQKRLAQLPLRLRTNASDDAVAAAESADLLLHPMIPGAGRLQRPVPWLARAALLERPAHPQRGLLHATIACRPLTARLLGRLIDLECHIRDQLTCTSRLPHPSEDLERRFHQAIEPHSVDRLLDPSSRRPMDSAWDLAGYGDLLDLLRRGDAKSRALTEARLLRNALAHGSAANWYAIQKVEDLEGRLA